MRFTSGDDTLLEQAGFTEGIKVHVQDAASVQFNKKHEHQTIEGHAMTIKQRQY